MSRIDESSTREGAAEQPAAEVAEVQGLYGPFAFSEKLLQKIWWRGGFDSGRATLLDGRRIAVVQPGRWNSLGGPDFKQARLRFGDEAEIVGDVELHLRAPDWAAHGHAGDAAYDDVRLHVVLFPPPVGHVTTGAKGKAIPVLALLPLLLHDLEEYAAEEAVERLANRPAAMIVETLGVLPPDELRALIAQYAAERWRQKVHFARLRVQRLGWEEACHQTAMEILGYRFNRTPMLRIAAARPLRDWANPTLSADEVFDREQGRWSLQGIRPANHPRLRLAQYATWARARADWPARAVELAGRLPAIEASEKAGSEAGGVATTGELRRVHRFKALRKTWAENVCAGAIGGTRFDNLMCDGFLPLLAANTNAGGGTARAIWFHWFPGDLPPVLSSALRQLGVFSGRSQPACHGAAQGLLGWLIERENPRASPSAS